MPTPKRGENREDFVSRCVPIVIEDQGLDADDEGDRKQAVAICFSMWRRAQEGKDMDDETTIDNDPTMTPSEERDEKQATAHTAVRLHGQGGIFSGQGIGEEEKQAATSFEQLWEMRQAEAAACEVMDLAGTFKQLTANIMASPDVEDKAAALAALAKEFTDLVEDRMGDVDELKTKAEHYKEVQLNDSKAVEIDFIGGCRHCGFGDKSILKEMANCPFCWNVFQEVAS